MWKNLVPSLDKQRRNYLVDIIQSTNNDNFLHSLIIVSRVCGEEKVPQDDYKKYIMSQQESILPSYSFSRLTEKVLQTSDIFHRNVW